MKTLPLAELPAVAKKMWDEFLGPDAGCPINVDGKSFEATKKNVEENPDRWCFDEAAVSRPTWG